MCFQFPLSMLRLEGSSCNSNTILINKFAPGGDEVISLRKRVVR